ncbi:methyltransferase domain-containing protein [Salinisphaera orenii]|uniref:methyltransferase domain-containing protein n=1 Tax=Salinisphaera orenii TaxID=856731 RepID=UPI000DBE4E85
MTDSFYKAFEDRFRGPEEEIKERLQVYRPFVDGLKAFGRPLQALDLGCGRGEWLELLVENDVVAKGVDLDEGMLASCREKQLDVIQGDAFEVLAEQGTDSLDILSAFHLVEHIPSSELQNLIQEAYRVLRPAGLLIMETPNPDNLVVGATNFYLDPTHRNPIPSPLLAFLTEFHGFARQKVLGLQESESEQETTIRLTDVLYAASPDYAVVAQVPGEPEQIASLDEAFSGEKGTTLESLAGQFDQAIEEARSQMRDWEKDALRQDQKADVLEKELESAKQRLEALSSELASARAQLEHQAGELTEKHQALESELKDVYASKSWRITWSLYKVMGLIRWLVRLPVLVFKGIVRLPGRLLRVAMVRTVKWLGKHPGLSRRISGFFRRFPHLHRRVKEFQRQRLGGQTGRQRHDTPEASEAWPENPSLGQVAAQELPDVLRTGGGAKIPIRIENRSDFVWESTGDQPVNAAYHWYGADGAPLVFDGIRTPLPQPIEPGQMAELDLQVLPPNQPGEHSLMLTLVREGVCWFEEQGFAAPVYDIPVDWNLPKSTSRVLEEMSYVIEYEGSGEAIRQ